MRRILSTTTLFLLACSNAASVQAPLAKAERQLPRLLVVSGANNHDWRWTTPSLVQILEQSGRFEVEVTYEPAKTLAETEDLARYSAFVLDYNGPRWGDAAEARFLSAVADDHVGVVVVHAADNAFPGWVEYEELVGDLWRDGTGHGSFHPFDIDVIDRDHPITRTLPSIIKHPDELYHKLVNTQGVERRVLGSAFSDPATGGTGANEPMIIVKDWRGARVFHTPLGHVWTNSPTSQASHRDPQFRGLLVRGTEWAATGTVSDELTIALSPTDKVAGWRSLMDMALWKPRDPARASRWEQRGDCIVLPAGAGSHDLVSAVTYADFELEFEWKTTIAGNSGVKYRVPEGAGGIVAPEYQLLDGAAEEAPQHRAGSLYDLYPCEAPQLAPWGSFNRSRIVVRGAHVEHWLNGARTVAATIGDEDFERRRAASKFKDNDQFGKAARGHIALQDHGDEVWFRGIRIRDLSALDERGSDVLPGADLAGWSRIGDAVYTRVDGELHGHFGPKQRQSFLVSEREYADFIFDVDLRFDALGNSGLQVRSHVTDGKMAGYQIEVDPSERAWSGGLYEEGRRGWLDNLVGDDVARAAFRADAWNHYRVECVGPHIRAWVNGVQTADHLDAMDLSGSLAFQVHGGDPDIAMRWRNARLVELGQHAWSADVPLLLAGEELVPGRREWVAPFGAAVGVRCDVTAAEATLTVGEHELRLDQLEGWRADAPMQVEVLRSGARCAVVVAGRTVADFADAATAGLDGAGWCSVGLTLPRDDAATVAHWSALHSAP
ncbi:MAG: family 16 glycoside hydrolase [Planctomycetota bacterium]